MLDEVDSGGFLVYISSSPGTPASLTAPKGLQRLAPLANNVDRFQNEARFDNPRAVSFALSGSTTTGLSNSASGFVTFTSNNNNHG